MSLNSVVADVITDDSAYGDETDNSVSMSLNSVAAGVIIDGLADGAESVKTFNPVDESDSTVSGVSHIQITWNLSRI